MKGRFQMPKLSPNESLVNANHYDINFMECEASEQLAKRAEHLAGLLTEEEAKLHETRFSNYRSEKPHDDIGTEAAIKWQPHFSWVKSVKINPKNMDQGLQPVLFHIYAHTEISMDREFLYFTVYRDQSWPSRLSQAKLMLSLGRDTICINALSSHERTHRIGSALIQIAIEYSFKNGYGGKVSLNSARDSGLFYFKLGFAPTQQEAFDELQNGKSVDGGEMYLPEISIKQWENKIAKNKILHSTIQSLPKISDSQCSLYELERETIDSKSPGEIILEILATLIKNIRNKNNNRATWFGCGVENKIKKLELIQEWVFSNNINDQNETKILDLISAACAIKRNRAGLFKPHSLIEFKNLVELYELKYSDNFDFSNKIILMKKLENITPLLEAAEGASISNTDPNLG
jgi:hypothetical protein